MNYTTVFDVAQSGYLCCWPAVLATPGVVLGIAILIAARHFKWRIPKWPIITVVVFSFIWMLTFLLVAGTKTYTLLSAELHGRCEITEGVVTNFVPGPYEGHQDESFVVGEIRFEYSDYDVRPGFHRSRSHGGPIHDGLHVRIYHVGDEIARLDVAK